MAKWRRSEWKWAKEWNERDHKSCLATLIMGGQAKISFAHARGVSGACPVRLFEKLEKVFLAKLGHQSRKRAERGWKSEAGPLSWKSGWKPLISRWFWAIGSYCIFFPFRDMAILKCPLGRIKFPMLKYGPVECLIWGMFQWAKQAFIGTVQTDEEHRKSKYCIPVCSHHIKTSGKIFNQAKFATFHHNAAVINPLIMTFWGEF